MHANSFRLHALVHKCSAHIFSQLTLELMGLLYNHTHTHTHTCTYTHTHTHMYIHTYTYKYMHTCSTLRPHTLVA